MPHTVLLIHLPVRPWPLGWICYRIRRNQIVTATTAVELEHFSLPSLRIFLSFSLIIRLPNPPPTLWRVLLLACCSRALNAVEQQPFRFAFQTRYPPPGVLAISSFRQSSGKSGKSVDNLMDIVPEAEIDLLPMEFWVCSLALPFADLVLPPGLRAAIKGKQQ